MSFKRPIVNKSYIGLGLILAVALVLILLNVFNSDLAAWSGWTAVIAIGALVASVSIVFAMSQYITQKGAYSLEQLKFMMSLAEEFSLHRQGYVEAWRVLRGYTDIPKEMDESEWSKVCDELGKCCKSCKFLFRIAQLDKSEIININLLYIFYYDEIIEACTSRLHFLIKWCGTGLDLAANYEAYELGRMAKAIKELITRLDAIHETRGGEPYLFHEEDFKRIERDFLSDLSRFDVASQNYVGNIIEIQKDDDD